MISDAALFVAQRLAAALMGLARTVTCVLAAEDDAPDAAWTLFHRLSAILLRLGRLDAFGPPPRRTPANAASAPEPTDHPTDDPTDAPTCANSPARRAVARAALPRRPGWLLDALPDDAPAVAADLAVLLADPAMAELLAAAPALQRELRPVLRGLGLAAAASPPLTTPPAAPLPPRPLPPPVDQPPPNRAARRAQAARRAKHGRHQPHRRRRTAILLRYQNDMAATPKDAAALPLRRAYPADRSARCRHGP